MAFIKYPETRLKAARELRGYSQTFVAESVGMTQSHLAKLEKRLVAASPETATRLHNFFGSLLTREEILYPEEFPVVSLPGEAPARKPAHPTQQLQEAAAS
jgi:transcriptional regulator with XRE-family HTH domain